MSDLAERREAMLERIRSDWVAYPRYRADWDDWIVAVVTRRVWRFGVAWFDKDEETLVAPTGTADGHREAYSWKLRLNLPLRVEDVRPLELA